MKPKLGEGRALEPRAAELLKLLVERYIHDGQPVGSRTLSRARGLELSPATIRNIMADLEDMGLLSAPHTSAGRVPTAQGYRVFVDSLLQVPSPLPETELSDLRRRMPVGAGTQALLSNATEMLSAMSHFVGVVTVPQRSAFAFRMIDFVALDAQRVLVILVFTDNEVQNRIITTRRAYSPSELEQTANYLNQPETVIEQILTGTFADGLGGVQKVADRIEFDPFPYDSFAIWILTQMKRWGQIKGDVDYQKVAKEVFLATDAQRLMKENGFAPPTGTGKKFFVMKKEFDPAKPEDYLKSFAIKRT